MPDPLPPTSRETVWVLDIVGYDARGGSARVFSTPDLARASVPHVKWVKSEEGWDEDVTPGSLSDMWVIYECAVDNADT